MKKHKNNKQVKLECLFCGDCFWVSPCRKELAQYCSRKCTHKTHGEKVSGSKSHLWKGGISYSIRQCLVCNREFEASIGNTRRGYGKFCSRKCYGQWKSKYYIGSKSTHWKGGITSESKMERGRFGIEVRQLILERDNFTCVLCDVKGGMLHVDHVQSWSKYPELRFELKNLRTLCVDCHYRITFGRKKPDSVVCWGQGLSQTQEVKLFA